MVAFDDYWTEWVQDEYWSRQWKPIWESDTKAFSFDEGAISYLQNILPISRTALGFSWRANAICKHGSLDYDGERTNNILKLKASTRKTLRKMRARGTTWKSLVTKLSFVAKPSRKRWCSLLARARVYCGWNRTRNLQRVLYNGRKWVHAIKFQSVVASNGLTASVGLWKGRAMIVATTLHRSWNSCADQSPNN